MCHYRSGRSPPSVRRLCYISSNLTKIYRFSMMYVYKMQIWTIFTPPNRPVSNSCKPYLWERINRPVKVHWHRPEEGYRSNVKADASDPAHSWWVTGEDVSLVEEKDRFVYKPTRRVWLAVLLFFSPYTTLNALSLERASDFGTILTCFTASVFGGISWYHNLSTAPSRSDWGFFFCFPPVVSKPYM